MPIATAVLCTIAAFGCGALFWEGRAARNAVTDWYPDGAQMGFDANAVTNATRFPQYGFVDLGADFQLPSHAAWSLDNVSGSPRNARPYLFIIADEPLFYAAQGTARITISGRAVGEIKALPSGNGGGPFVAGRTRDDLLVPPEHALGYQFPIAATANSSDSCKASCRVAIDCTFTFWRIYRIGFVRELRRFSSPAPE